MKFQRARQLMADSGGLVRVTALAFSPNSSRTAAVADRIVYLFDEAGERRDKFSTKPGEKVRRGELFFRLLFFPINRHF
jgi:intraflagellar transport protein 172